MEEFWCWQHEILVNRAADGAIVQRACPLKRVERFFIICPIARAGGGRCMVHIKILFVH